MSKKQGNVVFTRQRKDGIWVGREAEQSKDHVARGIGCPAA